MSCAIELEKRGIKPLIIEKGNIVNTIYHYPTHQTFFSSSDKLEIGGVPFITENQKPVRNQSLAYYREVAERKQLRLHTYERVTEVVKQSGKFDIHTENYLGKLSSYQAKHVIIATGYYDQPYFMNVPGEDSPKVMHYFKEAHPFAGKNVVVIGGKNSAVDTTLELHKAGANITVLYRGEAYSKSIKPWILPEFDSLVRKEIVQMYFQAEVEKITDEHVYFSASGNSYKVDNDFVFAMTGYRPDYAFLNRIGVEIDIETGKPVHDEETYETTVPDLYVAGVVAAGYNNNRIFIENGRFHGEAIAASIVNT